MQRKSILGFVLLILSIICSVSDAPAQWTDHGETISAAVGSQYNAEIIPDGAGGAIMVWMDFRSLDNYDIYAQRIDGDGNVLWTADGVAVCTAAAGQINPQIISDGAGGAIVVWSDSRSGPTDSDIYAQRVDANGNMLWTANGKAISNAPQNQEVPNIAPDGSGGAIICWRDFRNGTDLNIYAQHVDTGGNALWNLNGVSVCSAAGIQFHVHSVSDGAGGAIFAWRDERVPTDVNLYAQRLDSNGVPLWTTDGVPFCGAADYQDFFGPIISDGYGGAIIAWEDNRDGTNYDIYVQRINSNGSNVWDYNGKIVCSAIYNQYNPLAVSDGAGGVIIAWEDNRGPYYSDVYAQRIMVDGNAAWTADGIPISTVEGGDYRYLYKPVSDGAGGAIIVWEDYRFMYSPKADVYAQRIDGGGTVRWKIDGALVAASQMDQYYPRIALDGDGGAIFVWSEWGNDEDIFAQRLELNLGNWGRIEPSIVSVQDVAGDQGGKIKVEWSASRLDVFDERTVTYYSVWRALDPMLSPVPSPEFVHEIPDIKEDFQGRAYRVEKTLAGNYYWEWISNINASYLPGYAMTVPTLADSAASNTRWRFFQAAAHTADPFVFWMSKPDSGYSVDNLSPAAPQGLAGDYSYALGKLMLVWNANIEADLSHYAVYRGSGAGFIPSDLNRIATSPDTIVTDLPYPPEQPYYIKLSAVDIHGNESEFAVLPPESVTTPTMVTGFESSWNDEGYVEISWVMSNPSPGDAFTVERKSGADGVYRELSVEIAREGQTARFNDGSAERGNTYTYRVSAVDGGAGLLLFLTTVSIPQLEFALYQNYPNPFRSDTSIRFELPQAVNVELSVFDAAGRKVASLFSGRKRAGIHKIPFNSRTLASGVYFYKLKAGSKTFSKKMIIMH